MDWGSFLQRSLEDFQNAPVVLWPLLAGCYLMILAVACTAIALPTFIIWGFIFNSLWKSYLGIRKGLKWSFENLVIVRERLFKGRISVPGITTPELIDSILQSEERSMKYFDLRLKSEQ